MIDQLPVNTPNGVAGLDKDGKVSAAQLPVNAPNGIAGLGDDGKIAAAQLPSYVDDVVEGYYHEGAFYSDPAHREQITPESGKVYIDAETNITYRWSGTAMRPSAPTWPWAKRRVQPTAVTEARSPTTTA